MWPYSDFSHQQSFQCDSSEFLRVYGTAHHSVFPLLLRKNMTSFAGGFTRTAFFSFYLTHILDSKHSIAGPTFTQNHSIHNRFHLKTLMSKKGYELRYSHIGTSDDPSCGCTKFWCRVNDLTGTMIFVWGIDENRGQDHIEKSMLEMQYAWMSGAQCDAPCCTSNYIWQANTLYICKINV